MDFEKNGDVPLRSNSGAEGMNREVAFTMWEERREKRARAFLKGRKKETT